MNQKCQKKKRMTTNDLTRFLPYLNFSRFKDDTPCGTEAAFDYAANCDARRTGSSNIVAFLQQRCCISRRNIETRLLISCVNVDATLLHFRVNVATTLLHSRVNVAATSRQRTYLAVSQSFRNVSANLLCCMVECESCLEDLRRYL